MAIEAHSAVEKVLAAVCQCRAADEPMGARESWADA